MKLTAELDQQTFELNVKNVGERTVVQIGDRSYDVEVRQPEPGTYVIFLDNKIYESRVRAVGQSLDSFEVSLRNRSYAVTLSDPKRLRGSHDSAKQHHGAAEIVAPMPGKIVKIHVEVGMEVEKGQGIIVVEAMKMQNEMKSPRTGRVTSISVLPSATVNAGDVLAVIED